MPWIEPVTLSGEIADLVPLSHDHLDDLIEATKDGELYNLWYTMVPRPEDMAAEIARRLSLTGSMVPFSIIEKSSGQAVGMTTYMNIDAPNRHVEIGSTWYRKRVQRTGMNKECKINLLTYAFETLDAVAVEFRTHFFNKQSRLGIEGLGAKLDGILRNHMIMADGSFRDTCCYSITQNEWPAVKTHLHYQMNKPR